MKTSTIGRFALFSFAVCFAARLMAQPVGVGQWREHLPYGKVIALADADDKIYCATPYSLFYYDKEDQSVFRLSKVNSLSDIGISHIAWNNNNKTLVVAYRNTNIDLITSGGVTNISDIRRKSMPGNKTINRLVVKGDSVLLACGFGIVVLDVKRREISDTWFIGPEGSELNVMDIATNDSLIYAATSQGLYFASAGDPFLVSFTRWRKDTSLLYPDAYYNHITAFQNFFITNLAYPDEYSADSLYVLSGGSWSALYPEQTFSRRSIRNMGKQLFVTTNEGVIILDEHLQVQFQLYTYNPGKPFPNDALMDKDSIRWIADTYNGLVRSHHEWIYEFITLEGPRTPFVYNMAASEKGLWVASGGVSSSWGNEWIREGVSAMINEKWTSWYFGNTPALDTIVDFLSVAINPGNPDHVFVGTWGRGLLEFRDQQLINVYSPQNSSLPYSVNDPKWFGVAGTAFDPEGNFWCTASSSPFGLHRRSPEGNWKAFNLSPLVTEETLSQLLIDDYGQKWIVVARGQGIIVYDDNSTPDIVFDDQKKKLTTAVGNGELPSMMVNCLALDHDGEIWVGTDQGIAVFYSPANIFTNQNYDAQRIFIEQDGVTQYLLEFENITAIAVDGANRKWIGTQKAGVFLMSEDGTKQIEHFTAEDSPLLSDQITSIAINHATGEVFFGTDKGVVSYRGTATAGQEKHSDVLVFPNPVRENYNGYISISGLVSNADVKITDIAGGLVYRTTALGGQAVWNGKKFNGQKVNTGVYLVFSSNEDGAETMVAKILFIR